MQFVHPEDRTKVEYRLKERRTGDRSTKNSEMRLFARNGEERYFETIAEGGITNFFKVSSTGLYSSKKPRRGAFLGSFGIARDITEKKKTEAAIRESEEKYKILFEMESDAIAVIEIKTGNILEVNKSFIELYGYSREEVLKMKNSDFAAEQEETKKATQKKLNKVLVRYHRKKDGTVFPVEINANIFNYRGREVHIATIRDITERIESGKDLEKMKERLFQTQKMESIGRLAGGIAHDFNNILVGIMGYAELLKMQYNDQSTSEGKAAEFIIEGTKRAADLTRQLIGFAREGKYNPVVLNINSLIKETVKVSEKIFEKRIIVDFRLEKNISNIEADKNQLEQLFTNLFINAKDAMPNGGQIIITTENVFFDEMYSTQYFDISAGHYIKISVTDNGIGMSEEIRKQIFEPFYTTKEACTGLGLAMVYGIVKNHNGYIKVYSETGYGTTFTLYFSASENDITITEDDFNIKKGSSTILIADDEESVIELTKDMLSALGYEVIITMSSKEAVEIYRDKKENIDLVILDMIMSDKSGNEVFKELKEINPDVKVLLSSGYSKNGKASEILNHGALGFIQKPYSMQELSEAVFKALNR